MWPLIGNAFFFLECDLSAKVRFFRAQVLLDIETEKRKMMKDKERKERDVMNKIRESRTLRLRSSL